MRPRLSELSPFQMIMYFSTTGNRGIVKHLTERVIKREKLSVEQLRQLKDIEKQLAKWIQIEKVYGPGSSLNLLNTEEIEKLVFFEGDKPYFKDYIKNAEHYRAIMGSDWLWLAQDNLENDQNLRKSPNRRGCL